jgi:hypothetical protein
VTGPADKPLFPVVTVTFSAIVCELYAIALVVADPKYCPPATVAVDTAVIKPLPLTVMTGIEVEPPNDPVLLFTVASVAFVIEVPVLPDIVRSPPVTEIDPETVAQEVFVPSVVKYLPELLV